MKHMRKGIALLLTLALVIGMFSLAMISSSAAVANPFSDAAMKLDTEYAYDGELGAIYSPEATTFKVWAPLATEVSLNRYATGSDAEEGAADLGTTPMEKLMDGDSWTGVWTVTVEGDLVNTFYTYTITNPTHIYYENEEDAETVTHETQDIYSYAVGVNGNRSMVVDLSKTDPDGWDDDAHVYVDHQTDAIIWEVQVKDFSWNENSGVSEANRGKFLAFTETGTTLNNEGNLATCVDYLKELGVTHVQINPFYDFATIDEEGDPAQFNWGYDPKNYGVPEGSYSSNPYDGNVRINECKQMIQALHNAGIGVIMDVVYNHTYSVDSGFNYSVPEYYYRMTATGAYSQQSGCGNDTASERAMYRKYMRDMLLYWTNEYHIDGYRFDLMGVHDGETMNLIREDMDAIDSRILMYGEGWGGNTVFDPTTCAGTETFMCIQGNASMISPRIGFFNDQIRDGVKAKVFDGPTAQGFVNGNKTFGSNISYGVAANTFGHGNWTAISPEQCVTYASCHDNLTLYDKLVGATHPNTSDFRARYSDVIRQNKLAAAIISSCQGIDFILAGEEMGRSKDGDENSYKSAASLNMIDWSLIKSNADLVSYYKGLFELRKAFSPFTAYLTDAEDDSYAYYRTTGVTQTTDIIGFTIENNTPGEWTKVAVVYNGKSTDAKFKMSATIDKNISADTEWVIVANGSSAGVAPLGTSKGLTFEVPSQTAIIAVEKTGYEAAAIESSFSKLYLNSVYDKTGETLASTTILGRPGEGYSVSPDGSIPIQYELAGIDGSEDGVFGDEDTTVTYTYTDYIPASLTAEVGDVDGDGSITILDGTAVQRHLAGIDVLDEEHEKRGDYDYSGDTTIVDVTKLQRYLAGIRVNICKITTRYRGVQGEETKFIVPTTVKYVRLGEEYTTTPESIAYFELDEMPANASGIASEDVVVTYMYHYAVNSPVIHVKHDGDLDWAPSLWAWAYDGSGKAINAYESWPGFLMSNPDEDGWYTTTFPIPGGLNYYFIISKNGNPQTKDYGVVDGQNVGIEYADYPEIWVVIKDDQVGKGNDWVEYYNYNPDIEN